jgi:hypothetical protein
MPFTERIAKLHLAFLKQADHLSPTDEEFVSWVDSQLVAMRPVLYLLGPQKCWTTGGAGLRAWVLEARGVSISEYMVNHLEEADYLRWVERFATPTLAPDAPKNDIG